MKKIFLFFIIFFTPNAFALYTENIPGACGSIHDLYMAFEPHEHTCQSGYFLPANTDGCRACPEGCTCAGGTFAFNENEYQGIFINNIATTTMNNVCADNFPIHLYAVFKPNTVQLNYDNGNGTISSGTCTYDDLITLPETPPSRPGYTFSGWKLQQQNNNN